MNFMLLAIYGRSCLRSILARLVMSSGITSFRNTRLETCQRSIFFWAFSRDKIEHHRVLLARRTNRELRRLSHIGEGVEYSSPLGLTIPKVELVEEGNLVPVVIRARGLARFEAVCYMDPSLGRRVALAKLDVLPSAALWQGPLAAPPWKLDCSRWRRKSLSGLCIL